jgi:UDP-glucose 4-epimerase
MSSNGTRVRRPREARKSVLVTGGAGFIGSHLCEALLEQGHRVTVLDNLSTGRSLNMLRLQAASNFRFCEGDVADEAVVDRAVSGSDVVFHLAAAVGVRLILENPIDSFRSNVVGTENVLKAAVEHGTAKVLIASTSEVYGKVARIPQREDDDVLLGPTSYSRWSYAACKMLDEFLGLAYARLGAPVVCFRLFNTVGPRQTGEYGMVVPRFVQAALERRPLQVHGDGSQSRCFLHVSDAVDAILRLEQAPEAVGHVFNIGSTESVTILELAHRVLAATGRDDAGPATVLVPYDEAYAVDGFQDIRARRPDISKIHSFTGWQPRRTLDDILRDVIASHAAADEDDVAALAAV